MSSVSTSIRFRSRLGSCTLLAFSFASALASTSANAAPSSRDVDKIRGELPPALKPWVDWVLADDKDRDCIAPQNSATGQCVWPHSLSLEVNDAGGTFVLKVRVDSTEAFVPLPGDHKRWPLDVSVDKKDVVVETSSGSPGVRLKKGRREIRGNFSWDRLPENLTIPGSVGLIRLKVRGKERRRFERDASVLWLERQRKDEAQEDRLAVTVHRRVRDGIPLIVTTRISIEVSGAGREAFLGPVILPNFIPLRLSSPLPARVEDDGRIRIQVRPGSHVIEFDAYLATQPTELAGSVLKAPTASGVDAHWPQREVWVFEAAPDIRVVRVEGQSVDPTQTRLPASWQSLPAFSMNAGDNLRIVEERRGDSDPGPDRLQLQRTMWLDFDGKGMTIQDRVGGALRRSRRLQMSPPTVLGRVEAFGADQFITRLEGDSSGLVGVELRAQNIDLSATSRIEGSISKIPAVSWNHDFSSAQSVLHLPPGWRLVTALGVDSVSKSWMKTWSLLELFFLLIVTLGFFRLFGVVWASVALVTLALLIPEPGAPEWIFAFCLVAEGLSRVIPKGPFQIGARAFRAFLLFILVVVSIPFIVGQIRTGMYPALEDRGYSSARFTNIFDQEETMAAPAGAAFEQKKELRATGKKRGKNKSGRLSKISLQSQSMDGLFDDIQGEMNQRVDNNVTYQASLRDFDPKASVQTGPGLPSWKWRSVTLRWSGPVQKTQVLHLVLLSPATGFALSIVRVILLLLLLLCLFRLPGGFWPTSLKKKMGEHTGLFCVPVLPLLPLLALPFLYSSSAAAQTFPPSKLLQDLHIRLTESPACAPACATAGRLKLVATDKQLRIVMNIDVAAPQAILLPGTAGQWLPTKVLVNTRVPTSLSRSGDKLLLGLPAGRHRVVLEGRLPRRETVQIRMHLRPHHVGAEVDGWSLNGLHEDGQADEDLQLVRLRKATRSSVDKDGEIEAALLPPLVEVNRNITLNLDWEVRTTLRRLSPLGQAIVIEIPLIENEHVTTEGIRVADGKAQINLGANQSSMTWTSSLQERKEVELKAPKDVVWVETWTVTASPLWHVQFKGIPPTHNAGGSGRSFSPWPGETLLVEIARPHGIEGQTRTIEDANFKFQPGLRATDAALTMNVRSSLGGPHNIELPANSELVEVRIDNRVQPIRQKGRIVSLPLTPGKQAISLKWRQASGIVSRFVTPDVDVGLPLVNASVTVEVPRSRWVLFVWGPVLGPAILFWSLLVIVLLCAVVLSRVRYSPLSLLQWILLGFGLTQVPLFVSGFIAAWLILLGYRKDKVELDAIWFDVRQLLIVSSTFFSLILLVYAIQDGLLGTPDMQIRGNASSQSSMKWFVDRTSGEAPGVFIFSVPMFVYRVMMLLWALWLAWSLVRWLREGWQAFRSGGFWRTPDVKRPTPPSGGDDNNGGGGGFRPSGPGGSKSPGSTGPSGNPTPIPSGVVDDTASSTIARRASSSALPSSAPVAGPPISPIEMLNDAAGTLPPTATQAIEKSEEVELELPRLDESSAVPPPPPIDDDERSS